MSLINEALKKAQRERHDAPAPASFREIPTPVAAAPQPPAAPRQPARRGGPPLALIAGGVLLVTVSIGATLLILRKPAPSAPAVAHPPSPAAAAPAPVVESTPKATPTATPPPAPAATTPVPPTIVTPAPVVIEPVVPAVSAPAAPIVSLPVAKPAANAAEPAPAPQPTAKPAFAIPVITVAPAPPKPDERIATFVDAVRVAMVRSTENGGRVLMNDRVYRVNDTVDRTLGLKLTKIGNNTLTFTDANGATYEKNF